MSKSYDFHKEIRRGKQAYRAHFGTDPIGYRAPQRNIEPCELSILEDEGFEFDSSVFPSYRPGVYNNLDKPLTPYVPAEADRLFEIPIGATPRMRIPIAQSYLKLLGRPYVRYLRWTDLLDPLVFNIHLQDLYRIDSHDRLGQPKRSIMKRNLTRSAEIFQFTIELLRVCGYTLDRMTELQVNYTDPYSTRPSLSA